MSEEPFGDIPLFREIQRLLAAGDGPINLEIARQVALAVATEGRLDPPPTAAAGRIFAEAVADAEVLLAGYTRVPLVEPIRTAVVSRTEWIGSTLRSWGWLLEHLAEHLSAEFGRLQGGDETPEPLGVTAAIAQVAPLLLGIQTGTVIGHLATEVLGHHDFPVPQDPDRLTFVDHNVEAVARDYSLPIDDLRRWIGIRDAARHLTVTSVSWLQPYFHSLLTDLVDATDIDVGDIERRLMDLQSKGVEGLQSGIGLDDVLPVVPTERHSRSLSRLRAFIALLHGYAHHAAGVVGDELLSDQVRLQEGMARHDGSPSEGRALLQAVLGFDVDRSLQAAGATFCAAVVKLHGIPALNRAWEAADNLPTMTEIKDPFAWIERVVVET
ncbi:MAG: zinc-dependent metalloprotease [Actinomycetota bacterium]|nr:zinc-dependent metalloprotease [Actinomycetota bacterium]